MTMADCEHCKDPWQKLMRAPNGEVMHRAVHGCEIVWNRCQAQNGVPMTDGTVGEIDIEPTKAGILAALNTYASHNDNG